MKKAERKEEIRAEELLYLAGMSWEMDKMEEYQEEHQFSVGFEERQRKMIEDVAAGHRNYGVVKKERGKKMSGKKWIVFVAAAVLTAGLAVTVIASAAFGVKNILVKKEVSPVTEVEKEIPNAEGEMDTVIETEGYNFAAHALEGSKEFMADQEWSEFFWEQRNSEEHIRAVGRADENGKPEELQSYSSAYGVYDQADADKVDEIAQKYGLKLVSEPETVQSYQALLEKTGIEDFLLDKDNVEWAYARTFEEGSFSGDIKVSMELENGNESISGGVSVCRDGVFSGFILNMGDLSDYEEWEYTNQNGDSLNLMINNVTKHSYIFYKGRQNFVIFNMMDNWPYGVSLSADGGYVDEATGEAADGPVSLTREELEKLADMFKFSVF